MTQARSWQRYLDPLWRPVSSRGIVVPAQLHTSLVESLGEMNVAVLEREAPPVRKMALFLMDNEDYLVAEDFVVDVPTFQHEPDWFSPVVPDAAG